MAAILAGRTRRAYVLAIPCNHAPATAAGSRRADTLIAALPPQAWQKISAGAGAHGPREYQQSRREG
jgi:hypothetical protein